MSTYCVACCERPPPPSSLCLNRAEKAADEHYLQLGYEVFSFSVRAHLVHCMAQFEATTVSAHHQWSTTSWGRSAQHAGQGPHRRLISVQIFRHAAVLQPVAGPTTLEEFELPQTCFLKRERLQGYLASLRLSTQPPKPVAESAAQRSAQRSGETWAEASVSAPCRCQKPDQSRPLSPSAQPLPLAKGRHPITGSLSLQEWIAIFVT